MDIEYQRFLDEAKEYTRLRYKMLKLEFLEKSSQIIALIVLVIVVTVLLLAALTYFSFAAIHALKGVLGGLTGGFCIFGGLFILLMAVIVLFRKQIIVNPLIKQLSEIMFAEDDADNDANYEVKKSNDETQQNKQS
ncbi:MAG: phage holin family protein [Bacteroidales bacterium]|nr:phage holin family protein [Bacteroidales bacterium]